MDKKSPKKTIRKVILILLKILRWPVVYYGVLVGGFYGLSWIFTASMEEGTEIYEAVGEYGITIGAVLLGIMLLVSYLTSTFFTETFLVSTGLAAGMYLLGSLFLSAPAGWGSDYLEFDAMKMYVILALIAVVLLGDIIAFIVRKIWDRKNVRNMMKHT